MCYIDVILLSDVISSIGPKISDADTYYNLRQTFHHTIVTTDICFLIVTNGLLNVLFHVPLYPDYVTDNNKRVPYQETIIGV